MSLPRWTPGPKHVAVVAMVAASAVSVPAALAAGGGASHVKEAASHERRSFEVSSNTQSPEARAPRAGRVHLAVFRNGEPNRARETSAIAAPSGSTLAREMVDASVGEPYGVAPESAVTAEITSAETVWAVPGGTGACLAVTTSTGTLTAAHCAGYDTPFGTESGKFVMISGQDGSPTVTLTGLVPDGNAAVTVLLADGTTTSVPVVNNVYSISVNDPAAVLAKNADGAEVSTSVAVVPPAGQGS